MDEVLTCTWAFCIKHFPGGLVKKLKARFCVSGDSQTECVYFFETWSSIVDIPVAFVHAKFKPDEQIFVHQPAGFQHGTDLVLSLNHSHLKTHTKCHGLQQFHLDTCLFVGKKVIALCYVVDILFNASKDQDIDTIVNVLKKDGIMVWKEGSADGFLGVDIKVIGSTHLLLTQAGLTKHIVEDFGLCSSFYTATCTPAEMSPRPKTYWGSLLLVPSIMLLWFACCFNSVNTHVLTLLLMCISLPITPFALLVILNCPCLYWMLSQG
ncbi:hypothetical protein ACHAW6_011296 [Cyclotella cf. meneghiniana]